MIKMGGTPSSDAGVTLARYTSASTLDENTHTWNMVSDVAPSESVTTSPTHTRPCIFTVASTVAEEASPVITATRDRLWAATYGDAPVMLSGVPRTAFAMRHEYVMLPSSSELAAADSISGVAWPSHVIASDPSAAGEANSLAAAPDVASFATATGGSWT